MPPRAGSRDCHAVEVAASSGRLGGAATWTGSDGTRGGTARGGRCTSVRLIDLLAISRTPEARGTSTLLGRRRTVTRRGRRASLRHRPANALRSAGDGPPLPSAVVLGLARIVVVRDGARVDVAVPSSVPLAELVPDLLRLTGAGDPAELPSPWTLARVG